MSKLLYDILLKPAYSEKSTLLNGESKYVFYIHKAATKDLVKKAIESIFDVKVKAVNIMVCKGKTKRFKGVLGRRADRKKAIVSLEKGQEIELVSGA